MDFHTAAAAFRLGIAYAEVTPVQIAEQKWRDCVELYSSNGLSLHTSKRVAYSIIERDTTVKGETL